MKYFLMFRWKIMQKHSFWTHILTIYKSPISQPSPLILVGKKPVQVYHFSFIVPQFTLTENLPITQCFIKQNHLVTWFAAVVVCRTKGDQ